MSAFVCSSSQHGYLPVLVHDVISLVDHKLYPSVCWQPHTHTSCRSLPIMIVPMQHDRQLLLLIVFMLAPPSWSWVSGFVSTHGFCTWQHTAVLLPCTGCLPIKTCRIMKHCTAEQQLTVVINEGATEMHQFLFHKHHSALSQAHLLVLKIVTSKRNSESVLFWV